MLEVKRFPGVVDAHFFSSVYELLSRGESVEFKPRLNQEIGVTYDLLDIEVSVEKVRQYEDKGFLEVSDEVAFPSCPTCGEVRLTAFFLCPKCRSMNLEKRDLMIHYECNYLGPVEEFEELGEGVYRCPKCGKTISRIGIDYGRPGFGFTCKKCSAIFQIPLIELECRNGHRSHVQDLEARRFPVYRLSREVEKFASIYNLLEKLRGELDKRWLSSELITKIRGVSGQIHTTPLYVRSTPAVMVEIMPPDFLDEQSLLGVAIKALDIPNSITLVILPEDVYRGIEGIFNPEKVKVLRVGSLQNSIEMIADEVLKLAGSEKT